MKFFLLTLPLILVHGVSFGENNRTTAVSRESSNLKPSFGGKDLIETARLQIKPSFLSFFTRKGENRFQLMVDFQIPVFTAEGNIKWLVRSGGGYSRLSKKRPRFCSEFFQRGRDTNSAEYENCSRYLETSKFFFYWTAKTGLQYELRPFTVSLLGGGILDGPDGLGGQGSLSIGWQILDSLTLEVGAEALYHNDISFGFSVGLLFLAKKWMTEVSF